MYMNTNTTLYYTLAFYNLGLIFNNNGLSSIRKAEAFVSGKVLTTVYNAFSLLTVRCFQTLSGCCVTSHFFPLQGFPGLSNYFGEYNVIRTNRNDSQNYENKTQDVVKWKYPSMYKSVLLLLMLSI